LKISVLNKILLCGQIEGITLPKAYPSEMHSVVYTWSKLVRVFIVSYEQNYKQLWIVQSPKFKWFNATLLSTERRNKSMILEHALRCLSFVSESKAQLDPNDIKIIQVFDASGQGTPVGIMELFSPPKIRTYRKRI
jgi:hypothetical protein